MNKSTINRSSKQILILAIGLGILGIILGAFAAHGLKNAITETQIETFEVGVRYQLYTAFFLIFVGVFPDLPTRVKRRIFWLSAIGILFFSGSIYGLSTNDLTAIDFKNYAFITPIGGVLIIASWVVLLITVLKIKTDSTD